MCEALCLALCLALVSQVLHLFSAGGGLAEMQRLQSILNHPYIFPSLREPTVNHPYQYLQSFKSIILQTALRARFGFITWAFESRAIRDDSHYTRILRNRRPKLD